MRRIFPHAIGSCLISACGLASHTDDMRMHALTDRRGLVICITMHSG